MDLITVYAKHVPTKDEILKKYEPKAKRFDVLIFKDKDCKEIKALIPWHYTKSRPTRRNKYITLNCYKYKLEWLD